MSVAEANRPSPSSYDQKSSSSSWRNSSSSLPSHHDKHKLEESDEDLFTVPDVEAVRPSDSTRTTTDVQHGNSSTPLPSKRRRGRNPADREHRRLKRLLRNRVSAQQARERKKIYVNDLESKAKELQDMNSEMEEKISTLTNENAMLRKVLMNTRPKVDESIEPKHDQVGKS
ncbi:transcription factor HY5-like [Telopea speciosissima]|uniref:transcription factor HY5-like n=1 Tax=Telopea speciosissima TaxID=54955 RepID=UPI001CC41C1F|nr:transcription factor HY5-like [Telopea speciosissima]